MNPQTTTVGLWTAVSVALMAFAVPSRDASGQADPPPTKANATLALAGQIELARLVDLSAERLHVNIEYDASVVKGTVTLRLGGGRCRRWGIRGCCCCRT